MANPLHPCLQRFGLTGWPLPKNAYGRTYWDKSAEYLTLKRQFQTLLDDPGLGVLLAEPGVGKTAAIRSLCGPLPKPQHQTLYMCDTALSPLELYRTLAEELGLRPSHRRGQLWQDIKKTLVHMVDERHIAPLLIVDEAHLLSDKFLLDLSGFLNFAMDSRDLLTVWLVGLPVLSRTLKMQAHTALWSRVMAEVKLEPLGREAFGALIEHAFKSVGAKTKLLSDPAMELLYRASRGVLRLTSRLLRAALRVAHERNQDFLDEHVVEAAVSEVAAASPVGK